MRARLLIVGVAVLALAGGAYVVAPEEPEETFCTAEAMIGPEGKSYGRSHDRACQFVDEHGELLLYLINGKRICYADETDRIVDCDEPGARPPG
jgi:uncharacterized membrane protein